MTASLALAIVLLGVVLVGAAILYLRKLLSRVRGIDPLSAFTVYLTATLILGVVAFYLGNLIDPLLSGILMALPQSIAMQLVYILAVIVAAFFAANAVVVSMSSTLAMNSWTSRPVIAAALSRSDTHSTVQPLVNAFGNHASTTNVPR